MTIKKRPPVDRVAQAAAIEAFGAAAETAPPATARPAPQTRTVPSPREAAASRESWPTGVAKTLLIRYPDPELPALLEELSHLDERSQHAIAVRALRRGLDALRAEALSK